MKGPNDFRQRCLLRSHWTFGVTQGGQQSSQPGGLHFWQRAVSDGMNCTFLYWRQEMKSFGREVRNLASRWAVQFVIAWTTAPTPTYLSDKYYHVLMREWNLVISGVKRTKTYQDDVWTLLTGLSISAALASLRGLIEVKSDSWVSSRSWTNPMRWQIENTHEIMRWVLHVSAANLKMLRGRSIKHGWGASDSSVLILAKTHTDNTCLPPPGKLSWDAERSFELPRKPEDTSGDTLGRIRAWVAYEGLVFCGAQTLQQDRSSESSFAV